MDSNKTPANNNVKDRVESLDKRIEEKKAKHASKDEYQKKEGAGGEKVLAELVAGIIFGLFFGFLIDDYFDTKPLFLITFIILGLAGSFYNIYKDFVVNDSNDNNHINNE